MAILNIMTVGDEILREKNTQEVKRFNHILHKLLDDMADTMYEAPGVGLAAPQVGISKKIVVIDVGEGLLELINPVITKCSGEDIDEEGCLSVPEETGNVLRYACVSVEAQDRHGEKFVIEDATDLLARCLQHEIDHLNGILFIDKKLRDESKKRFTAKKVQASVKK